MKDTNRKWTLDDKRSEQTKSSEIKLKQNSQQNTSDRKHRETQVSNSDNSPNPVGYTLCVQPNIKNSEKMHQR